MTSIHDDGVLYFAPAENSATSVSDGVRVNTMQTRTRHGLRSLRDGVLGEFTRQDEADRGLDLARRDGRLLRVRSKLCGRVRKGPLGNIGVNVLDASVAIRSKMSLTKEFRMAIALLEIPVSGWTCLSTDVAKRARGKFARDGSIAEGEAIN